MAKAPSKEVDVLTEASEAFGLLSIKDQGIYLSQLAEVHEAAKQAKRAELLAMLDELGGVPAPTRAPKASGDGRGNRTSPAPKYRSKKDPSLTWSGRGQRAGWLNREMEETGKGIDYFLIDHS